MMPRRYKTSCQASWAAALSLPARRKSSTSRRPSARTPYATSIPNYTTYQLLTYTHTPYSNRNRHTSSHDRLRNYRTSLNSTRPNSDTALAQTRTPPSRSTNSPTTTALAPPRNSDRIKKTTHFQRRRNRCKTWDRNRPMRSRGRGCSRTMPKADSRTRS